MYLQKWNPSLQSNSGLPKDILQMLQTGKELNVSFEALKMSDTLKERLPAWYHIGVGHHLTSLNNRSTSKCLRENHLVKTVGDLMKNTKRGRDNSPQHAHHNRINCACKYCAHDRNSFKCKMPNKCFEMARAILQQIQPKWQPGGTPPMDNLTHTIQRKQANTKARKDNDHILFDPSITAEDDLSHNFRIFTDNNAKCCDPAYRKHSINLPQEEITVYTDGSCLEGGTVTARAGAGIWFGPNDPRNASLRVPGAKQTNQVG